MGSTPGVGVLLWEYIREGIFPQHHSCKNFVCFGGVFGACWVAGWVGTPEGLSGDVLCVISIRAYNRRLNYLIFSRPMVGAEYRGCCSSPHHPPFAYVLPRNIQLFAFINKNTSDLRKYTHLAAQPESIIEQLNSFYSTLVNANYMYCCAHGHCGWDGNELRLQMLGNESTFNGG